MILIDGVIDKEQLFESLRGVEEEEEAKSREVFEVPFQRPCPPFNDTVEKEVELPDGKALVGSFLSSLCLLLSLSHNSYIIISLSLTLKGIR